MARPPLPNAGDLERRQVLLAAEERRLQSVEDWKGTIEAMGLIALVVGLVVVLGGIVFSLFS